jgi:signal recognition particle receptor subunit alpha
MLDFVAAFERGGAVLWMLQFAQLRHSPLDAISALVRGCLLEERLGESTFVFTPKSGAAQALKWTFHNGLGLVFVAAYQKALSLLYVDELLASVRDEFAAGYSPAQRGSGYSGFDEAFQRLLRDAEARADAAKRQPVARSAPAVAAKEVRERSRLSCTFCPSPTGRTAPDTLPLRPSAHRIGLARSKASRTRRAPVRQARPTERQTETTLQQSHAPA